MAHKAKPKSKLVSTTPIKTNSKAKVNPRKTNTTEKTKSLATTNDSENKNISCSFTEPTIRAFKPVVTRREAACKPNQKPQHNEEEGHKDTQISVAIVHRLKRHVDFDIFGKKSLATWKKSSGQSKSWGKCRRSKSSEDDLRLMIESRSRPIALGWRISTTLAPSSFFRSQGMGVNSKPPRKGTSIARNSGHLAMGYERYVAIPRGRPMWGWSKRQGNEFQVHWGFLRLTIACGVVSIRREPCLTDIIIWAHYGIPEERKPSTGANYCKVAVLRLLRNESHADIYLVQHTRAPFEIYHAHAFLDEGFSGNWSTFAKRKMKHLRGSCDFVSETMQDGKVIIVMESQPRSSACRPKNTLNEFPPLPGTGLPKSTDSRPKGNVGRLSYAAIVVGKKLSKPHKANRRAYKDWEARSRKRKNMIENKGPKSGIPELSQSERTGGNSQAL